MDENEQSKDESFLQFDNAKCKENNDSVIEIHGAEKFGTDYFMKISFLTTPGDNYVMECVGLLPQYLTNR